VAFDCDGVLFDTVEANRAYYNYILAHFGRPAMDENQLRYVHIHTVQQAVAHLFADAADWQAALAFQASIDYGQFLKYLSIEPYLKALLDWMCSRYKTAIATNRTTTMDRLLREFGLADRFDMVVTSLDVERPKPFPDPLFKILSRFRVEPRQAVFVGDSEVDEATARAAGVPFVAYRNPALEANWHIESLKDLEGFLQSSGTA
jgi:HAD superfamily hydrolase (TIGR01509 family)